jgi:hypothetical protein
MIATLASWRPREAQHKKAELANSNPAQSIMGKGATTSPHPLIKKPLDFSEKKALPASNSTHCHAQTAWTKVKYLNKVGGLHEIPLSNDQTKGSSRN